MTTRTVSGAAQGRLGLVAGEPVLPAQRMKMWADGASRGNPGPSGAGAVVKLADGSIVGEVAEYLGTGTNNRAEYTAALLGLQRALELGGREIDVYMDSQLVVRQMEGLYKVKNAGLRPLWEQVGALSRRFARCTFHHVPREQNSEADALANEGVDSGLRR